RLFRRALELDSEARTVFLENACGEDRELLRHLETLLDDESAPAATQASTLRDPAPAAKIPDQIGNYRPLQQIGEGGMGEVYLADQLRPIRRRVALKVVRRGLETKQVIARFESERQALAMMDHPNIARVLDAGTTEDGRPFFIMEYVDGVPITDYCDRQRLSTRARLELLVQVCEGLQHAHQKAVIHRDIKPSNVLVTVRNDRPMPKIIDFGIAKATAQRLTERTLFTEHGQLIGTPEYMSPEQAQLTSDEVDTRTDIYSLGVLMYELLVGVLPFESKELRRGGLEEILRRIREDEPPRPSTRVSTAHAKATTDTASRRRTTTGRLTTELRGDLDWITMKALDKDRARRYRSAAELADDLGRYLRNEPVSAGPPSATYRARKFVRRHRVGVGVAAGLLVLLVAFSVVSAIQAARIARERDRASQEAATAREISEFLVGLFEVSDPSESRGNSVTAREILDEGAEQIEALSGQPRTQAALSETIGGVYMVLGLYDAAQPLLEDALAIREREADDELALAGALHALATLLDVRGDYEPAEPLAARSVAIRERLLGDAPELAESLNTLANVAWHRGRLDEAEEIHRRALAIREAALGPDDPSISQTLHNIGCLRYFAADYAEAERMLRRCIEISEPAHGPDDWRLATTLHVLAIVLQDQGRLDEALELEQRALAIREQSLGADHPYVALSLTTLGNIYRGMDRAADALPSLQRAVQVATAAWGPEHGEVWWMRRSLARALIDAGRPAEAAAELESLIELIEGQDDEASLPMNLIALGKAYHAEQRFAEAEATYRRGLEIAARIGGDDDPDAALARAGLANVQRDTDRPDEAEANYEQAIAVMGTVWGEGDPDRLRAMRDYAELLERVGRGDEAGALLAEADALERE
ncbi:MAG: tetratricopeptide repeat protein, partial [Planctomycetota bacterium]